ELRESFQRRDARLDHEGEHRQLEALLLGLGGLRLTERLEVGDVRVVALRDVRNRDPVAMEIWARQLLDARERLHLNRPELREVDVRPRRQIEGQCAAAPFRGGGGPRSRTAGERAFDEGLHVAMQDAALRTGALK